jgi:hypothetical protein
VKIGGEKFTEEEFDEVYEAVQKINPVFAEAILRAAYFYEETVEE